MSFYRALDAALVALAALALRFYRGFRTATGDPVEVLERAEQELRFGTRFPEGEERYEEGGDDGDPF